MHACRRSFNFVHVSSGCNVSKPAADSSQVCELYTAIPDSSYIAVVISCNNVLNSPMLSLIAVSIQTNHYIVPLSDYTLSTMFSSCPTKLSWNNRSHARRPLNGRQCTQRYSKDTDNSHAFYVRKLYVSHIMERT